MRNLDLVLLFTLGVSVFTSSAQNSTIDQLRSCLTAAGIDQEIIYDQISTPEQYAQLNVQWNIRGGIIYPLAYLEPESSTEIQKAVICGRRLQIRIVPKNGGHNFAKYGFGDSNSLIIDLQRMSYVNVDVHSKTAFVGAGTRLGKLVYEIWEAGNLSSTVGQSPSVGVTGFSFGGGKGPTFRRFGLQLDNLLEVEMVDAEGRLLIANTEINADLFWALRGGGNMNFGIATKIKLQLHDAPPEVITHFVYYDMRQFPEILAGWQRYSTSNLTIFSIFRLRPTGIILRIDELLYPGEDNNQFEKLMQFFPPPLESTACTTEYSIWLMELCRDSYGGFVRPNVNITQPSDLALIGNGIGTMYHKRKSFIINRILNQTEILALYQLFQEVYPTLFGWIEAFGGRLSQVGPSETAFVHRDAVFQMVVYYEGEEEDPEWLQLANYFIEQSKLILNHKATYQNYVDDEIEDYLERYYGSNLERLIQIKTKYDPDNYFWNPQSIPVRNSSLSAKSGTFS